MATKYDGAGFALTNAGITWDTDIRITKIGSLKQTVQVYDDTPLSEVAVLEKVFSSLVDHEGIEVEHFADPDKPAPIDGIPGTWVITAPVKSGQTNGATITMTGAIIAAETGDKAHGARSMSKFTLMPDGKTGPTFAAGA